MGEEQPFSESEEPGPTPLELDHPNVASTFDSPPSEDARRVHDASIRRHLKERRDQEDPPPSDEL